MKVSNALEDILRTACESAKDREGQRQHWPPCGDDVIGTVSSSADLCPRAPPKLHLGIELHSIHSALKRRAAFPTADF